MSDGYCTIAVPDIAAYVELKTAILDHVIRLGRSIRDKVDAGESVDCDQEELAAANRALSAVLGAK